VAKEKRSTPFRDGSRLYQGRKFRRTPESSLLQDPAILITGRDEALLSTRGSVLKAAGYGVTTTVVPIERADDLSAVDLLVVCHTLNADQREHDLAALHESNPQAKALCLVPHAGRVDPQVAVLNSFTGPYQMLQAVEQCLATS
jgi:hypothetical protein